MAQEDWWEKFPDAAQSQGGVVTRAADPRLSSQTTQARNQAAASQYDPAKAASDAAKAASDAAKAAHDARTDPVYDRNTAIQGWIDNIRNDKRIATYEMSLPVWASGLRAPPTPEGDQLLVNTFAKVMDPLTGIQQGESQQIQGLAPSIEQLRARLGKEFGMDASGNFTPEARQRIKLTVTARMRELADQYRFAREDWRQKLKMAGLPDVDPEVILGNPAGLPFQKAEADFLGRPVRNLDGTLGGVPPGFNLSNMPGAETTYDPSMPTGPLGPITITDETVEPERPMGWGDAAQQAGQSLLNVGAGIAEGATALPDMLAKGMGQVMAAPVDWLGFDQAANELRNPLQIGQQIEQAVPVPQNSNDWWARQAARLEGGILGLPAKATTAAVEQLVGAVPRGFNPASVQSIAPIQTYRDAQSLGIEPTAEAVGGPGSRTLTSLLAQSLFGAGPTKAGAERMVEQGGKALSNIAGREGSALTREGLGEAATAGAKAYRTNSRNAIGALYDRAATMAGDVKVKPELTLTELDNHIQQLQQIPGGGEGVAYLQTLRNEIAEGFPDGITIEGFRGMRSALRDRFIKDGLRGSDVERRVNEVIQAASDDISASLAGQGKQAAAQAFKRADMAWAERVRTIDEVIAPIIGRKGEKSGEQVAAALVSASRANGARLNAFIKALPEEEAGNIRATLIEGLGKAKAGAQDAEGDVFSFAELLTNWNKLSGSAKNAMFESADRAAMDKLVRVSSELKEASRYANTSRSGGVFINGLTLFTGMVDTASGAAVAGGSYLLAKTMATPGFAKIVAQLGSAKTPQQVKAVAGRFGALARQYPGAASDLIALRDGLVRAANDNAARVTGAVAPPFEDEEKRKYQRPY